MRFDRTAILVWPAGKDRKHGKDSIWLAVTDSTGRTTENIPTRHLAAARLHELTQAGLARGERLLIGADFAFGNGAACCNVFSKDGMQPMARNMLKSYLFRLPDR